MFHFKSRFSRCFFRIALSFALALPAVPGSASVWSDHIAPSVSDGFDTKGWIIIGTGAALVALAQSYDGEVQRGNRDTLLPKEMSEAGDFLGTGIPGAAIVLTQLAFDTNSGIAHTEALLTTFFTTYALKFANQRRRPESENRLSMPSGHTSTAFTSATSLTYAYGWKAAVPGYLLATMVAMSRINDNAHWLSDTIAGATIGIFWGRATSLHHLGVSPVVFRDGGGLNWTYTF